MFRRLIIAWGLLSCLACNFPFPRETTATPAAGAFVPTPVPTVTSIPAIPTPDPLQTNVPAGIATLVPSPVASSTIAASATHVPNTPTPFIDPFGCSRPPDDYSRLTVNGSRLNFRTVSMLRHAQTLYNGTIDFAGRAVTQGSYNPGQVTASFGTHDGGGAVDIAVTNLRTGAVLRNELPDAIRALRTAGFAAWVRETNELYRGSVIHIHAIAIGDREIAPAAREQLTGIFGYFRGFNGLPQQNNVPIPDRHGGPIVCKWMIEMGYQDLRQSGG
jgi:hypothetical protein